MREPRLFHELIAERIAERRVRPEEAPPAAVGQERGTERTVHERTPLRLAPRSLLALGGVLVELHRARLRPQPLHGSAPGKKKNQQQSQAGHGYWTARIARMFSVYGMADS